MCKKGKGMINQVLELSINKFQEGMGGDSINQSIHGISHWQSVRQNAIVLSHQKNVDAVVTVLFAYLHDCCRRNDGVDEEHGERASEFVKELYDSKVLRIRIVQLEELIEACHNHNKGVVTDNATIGVCYDSDRLELTRCGILPNPDLMSTDRGKYWAEKISEAHRRIVSS